jgi:hypothetical protein
MKWLRQVIEIMPVTVAAYRRLAFAWLQLIAFLSILTFILRSLNTDLKERLDPWELAYLGLAAFIVVLPFLQTLKFSKEGAELSVTGGLLEGIQQLKAVDADETKARASSSAVIETPEEQAIVTTTAQVAASAPHRVNVKFAWPWVVAQSALKVALLQVARAAQWQPDPDLGVQDLAMQLATRRAIEDSEMLALSKIIAALSSSGPSPDENDFIVEQLFQEVKTMLRSVARRAGDRAIRNVVSARAINAKSAIWFDEVLSANAPRRVIDIVINRKVACETLVALEDSTPFRRNLDGHRNGLSYIPGSLIGAIIVADATEAGLPTEHLVISVPPFVAILRFGRLHASKEFKELLPWLVDDVA